MGYEIIEQKEIMHEEYANLLAALHRKADREGISLDEAGTPLGEAYAEAKKIYGELLSNAYSTQEDIDMLKNMFTNIERSFQNRKHYNRILAIGDIHGKFSAFDFLFNKINFSDRDLLVFLGDYIDRGRQNREMIEWVLGNNSRENIVFLRGNHEQMCLDALTNKENKAYMQEWLDNGGDATLKAFRSQDNSVSILHDWLRFIEHMPLCYSVEQDGKSYIFVHAGIDSKKPLSRQDRNTLLWDREFINSRYSGSATVIVGHTPVQFAKEFGYVDAFHPLFRNGGKIIMADTGSYLPNGFISCVDVLTGKYVQSNSFSKSVG